MNTFSRHLLFAAFIASGVAASAGETLTAATLAAWQVHGKDAPAISNQSVTLPAGTDISRSFSDDSVQVHLVSRPFFGTKAADVPALEIGPVSLSFLRDKNGGALILLGDQTVALPQAIALDAEGRSTRQLDLTLAFDGPKHEAVLSLDNAAYRVTGTASKKVMVALSAGNESGWVLDSMDVTTAPAAAAGAKADDTTTGKKAETLPFVLPANTAERAQNFTDAVALFTAGKPEQAEEKLFALNRHKPGTLGWYLESAGKLTHMSLVLRQQYDLKNSLIVADRAQALLAKAEKISDPKDRAKERAQVHELGGYLSDELQRDPKAARASYEKAKQLDPTSQRAAREIERLDDEEAKAKRVGAKN